MKRLFALLLAAIMVLSLITVAFAVDDPSSEGTPDEDTSTGGSITIKNVHLTTNEDGEAVMDSVYDVYLMLRLESYSTTGKQAYSYVIDPDWMDFFTGTGEGAAYITLKNTKYVEWTAAQDATTLNAFSASALKYIEDEAAKGHIIAPKNTTDPDVAAELKDYVVDCDKKTLKFQGLDLGYYLVDSDVGILCGLTTTNPDAEIDAKNGAPVVVKKVQEDSQVGTDTSWGEKNTADIGQRVEFDTTITVHAGAQNYILHDTMDDTLEFDATSVVVYVKRVGASNTDDLIAGVDYTLNTAPENCTFEIVFTPDFCKGLATGDQITVRYSAILGDNAVIGGDGNKNETYMTYGETNNHTTIPDTTVTYTYGFDLVKTESSSKLLDGAEFQLFNTPNVTEGVTAPLTFTLVTSEGKTPVYRYDPDGEVTTLVVIDGYVQVTGLDAHTYYLKETKAPEGYQQLQNMRPIEITDSYLEATVVGDQWSTGGVRIQNSTGSLLPSTGAEGTVAFITFGFFVMLATGVLLITRKRMTMIED